MLAGVLSGEGHLVTLALFRRTALFLPITRDTVEYHDQQGLNHEQTTSEL